MTMPKPRRPFVASLPFAAVAILAMTAATTAPRPTSLSAIAAARGPQDYPTRAQVAALALANVPALANAADTSSYAVIVLDANNNFVKATAGYGNCIIQVWADPLDHAGRRARSAERTGTDGFGGSSASGGSGRGGRGGGSVAGSTGTATGTAIASRPAGERPRNAYMGGPAMMGPIDPATGKRPEIPRNNAPGMHRPEPWVSDDSGIDGIPASNLTSMDTFMYGDGELGGHKHIRVVVVTTNTIGPVR